MDAPGSAKPSTGTSTPEVGTLPPVADQQQAITYSHPQLGAVTISIAYPNGESMFVPTVRATVNATGETVYEWSGDDGRYTFAFAGTELNSDITNPVDGRGHVFFEWDPGRLPGVSYLVPTSTGFDAHGTLTDSFYDGYYDASIVDTDGDGKYEIDKHFQICKPSCAEGYTFSHVWTWDGSAYTGSDIDPETGKSANEESGDAGDASPGFEVAEKRFTDYLLTAGAGDYAAAWAMLEPAYQEQYGGFGDFTKFWDGIESVGIDDMTASAGDGATLLDAVLSYRRVDGTKTREKVYVTMIDGDPPMIGDYQSVEELD